MGRPKKEIRKRRGREWTASQCSLVGKGEDGQQKIGKEGGMGGGEANRRGGYRRKGRDT